MTTATFKRLGAAALCALIVTGCATTSTSTRSATTKSVPARIETEEAVGFTITEEARIGSDVRAGYDRAQVQLEAGDTERAIALLEDVAAEAPGLSAPHIDLGIAYHRAGRLEAAEAALAAYSEDYRRLHTDVRRIQRRVIDDKAEIKRLETERRRLPRDAEYDEERAHMEERIAELKAEIEEIEGSPGDALGKRIMERARELGAKLTEDD